MILGVGIDIVEIKRIKKIFAKKKEREKFLARIYTKSEIDTGLRFKGDKQVNFFAKRFAAKEAAAKALGTGFGENLSFVEIGVNSCISGEPEIFFTGKAAKLAKSLCIKTKDYKAHVSLADEAGIAQAIVIISAA